MPEPVPQPTIADLRAFSKRIHDAAVRAGERRPVRQTRDLSGSPGANAPPSESDLELDVALEELRVAEEELRQQNEELARSRDLLERERLKYYELFDFAPDPYLVTDSAGIIHEANFAATQLLGIPQNFLIGKPLPTFFEQSAKRSWRQQVDRLCGAQRLDDWEMRLHPRHRDPVQVSVSIGQAAGNNDKASGYRWILRDITRRKEAEDALRQTNQELEVRVTARTTQLAAANQLKDELLLAERKSREEAEISNRVKSEFLALLSHEFRTPLQAIFGYTELLEREIHGPITDNQRRDLQRIQLSQQHLLGLINTILEFARLDSGKEIEVVMGPVVIHDALAPMEAMVGSSLETKNLGFSYSCTDRSIVALADAAKVQQIVLNLLANAIKFTPAGGLITLGCEIAEEYVAVSVRDSGRGIPPDKLETIFEPFVQLRNQGGVADGTGLGLPISRRLATAMGATLSARSTLGEGSTFTLRLQNFTGSAS